MKKYLKGFVSGFLVCVLLSTSVAYAATGVKIEVYFNNLKYLFDGVAKTPTDTKGFIYKGTTFVPLRFVSEALGKEVLWDGATETIRIDNKGTNSSKSDTVIELAKNAAYLSALVYDTKVGDASGLSLDNWENFAWNANIGDPFQIAGKQYLHGIGVHLNRSPPPSYRENGGRITYTLSGKYKKLTGFVGIDDSLATSKGKGKLTILGDGKELSVTSDIVGGKDVSKIDIDMTNVKVLEIQFDSNRNDNINMVFADATVFE